MTREWKPGDVAVAKYPGNEPKTYIRQREFGTGVERWISQEGTTPKAFELAEWFRPLVVIDPEDREQVERLIDYCWAGGTVEAWQQYLRGYADPKPPKPEEPTGRYAVVVDDKGVEWLRDKTGRWCYTAPKSPGLTFSQWVTKDWANIAVARVLSEGVTP